MQVLVIGGGGREHALAWKAAQSERVDHVFVAPGNAGTDVESQVSNVDIGAENIDDLLEFAVEQNIDLTIVGPEAPLVDGIVDRFEAADLRVFGPSAAAAQLEGSKAFSKEFLIRHAIPTAAYATFTDIEQALAYVRSQPVPIVVKADGLAAGKGVIIAQTLQQAEDTIRDMLSGNSFGEAGSRVVIEEFMTGEEASFICMVDGHNVLPMASSQDHKARDNGDQGPNTGGMGAYSPAPVVDEPMHKQILEKIIEPTVAGMQADGNTFRGFLYAGLMIGEDGVAKVVEFNVRFGDPETQPILMRLNSDLIELCLAVCEGQLNSQKAEWSHESAVGVVMAAGGYPEGYARGSEISGLQRVDEESVKVFHAGTTTNSSGSTVTNGGRVLCVVGLGETVAQAQQRAYAGVERIQWDGAFYRTDIAYRAISR